MTLLGKGSGVGSCCSFRGFEFRVYFRLTNYVQHNLRGSGFMPFQMNETRVI